MSNTEYLGLTVEIDDDGEDHAEYVVRDADNEMVGSIDRWFNDRSSQFSPCFKRGSTNSWTFNLFDPVEAYLHHDASAFKTWRSAFKAFVHWAIEKRQEQEQEKKSSKGDTPSEARHTA